MLEHETVHARVDDQLVEKSVTYGVLFLKNNCIYSPKSRPWTEQRCKAAQQEELNKLKEWILDQGDKWGDEAHKIIGKYPKDWPKTDADKKIAPYYERFESWLKETIYTHADYNRFWH